MITCTSCTVWTRKLVKTLVITDKETGKEIPLPEGYHIGGLGDKLALVQRISQVRMVNGKKSITWESKENPRYTVENGERTINQESDKTFNGTKLEAEAAGWVENEWGFVCPNCTGDLDDEATSVNPLEDPLVATAVLASLKNGREKT